MKVNRVTGLTGGVVVRRTVLLFGMVPVMSLEGKIGMTGVDSMCTCEDLL